MDDSSCLKEDWELLVSFFPEDWRALASASGAVKGLRQDKDEERLLRTLLLHVGCGHSLRETAVRARQAGLADLSDVALLKRLRKSEAWLRALCERLFAERGIGEAVGPFGALRLIDATRIEEPGKTGSSWRIHYSLAVPSLRCDFFELTPVKGKGTGESLKRYEAGAGEHLLADRGYSNAQGIAHIVAGGADLTVRLCPRNVRILDGAGGVFALDDRLEAMKMCDETGDWPVVLADRHGGREVAGRLCAIRKSRAAIDLAKKKLRRRAQRSGEQIQESTFLHAEFVLVFTTIAPERLCAADVLELYRIRWQVELVFKRFKQLAALGHVPKHDAASSRAWLYGKMFVALLTEKVISHAEGFSPWGYRTVVRSRQSQSLAGVPFPSQ